VAATPLYALHSGRLYPGALVVLVQHRDVPTAFTLWARYLMEVLALDVHGFSPEPKTQKGEGPSRMPGWLCWPAWLRRPARLLDQTVQNDTAGPLDRHRFHGRLARQTLPAGPTVLVDWPD
jgi:hypothetical protein